MIVDCFLPLVLIVKCFEKFQNIFFSIKKREIVRRKKNRFPYHSFFNLALSFLSEATGGGGGVVRDEPVVDVEDDEEGGEAGDGHHV